MRGDANFITNVIIITFHDKDACLMGFCRIKPVQMTVMCSFYKINGVEIAPVSSFAHIYEPLGTMYT